MEPSQACLTVSEKAWHRLDLLPVELQRTSEKNKNNLLLRQCYKAKSVSAEAKQGKGLTGVHVNSVTCKAPCPNQFL